MQEQENPENNAKKIHESINRLLNTKTNLKRKKKSQVEFQKQLFVDVMNGIMELSNLHLRLGKEGVFIDSYYSLALSTVESTLELFLGKDILSLIIYYLEISGGGNPTEVIYDGDEKPLIIENLDQLWDLIVKIKPSISEDK